MARRFRATRAVGATSAPTPIPSNHTTPLSSAYPSTYASEDERDYRISSSAVEAQSLRAALEKGKRSQARTARPFRFLDLPPELRLKIYAIHFQDQDAVVDLEPDLHKRVGAAMPLLRTCRQIYDEASAVFFESKTFRVFPTNGLYYNKKKRPLLARLTASQRERITSLELRLGPGWDKPPKGWVVTDVLGLRDCKQVHKFKVFVEVDPSDGIFSGWRRSEGLYEAFSSSLLSDILCRLPSVEIVELDAENCVKKSGAMMRGLLEVVSRHGLSVSWGPKKDWATGDGMTEQDASLPAMPARYVEDRPGGLGLGSLSIAV